MKWLKNKITVQIVKGQLRHLITTGVVLATEAGYILPEDTEAANRLLLYAAVAAVSHVLSALSREKRD